MHISTLASSLIILFGSVLALIFGKMLLLPFLFSLLIYFLIRAIRRFIDRSSWIRRVIPSWIKSLISAAFIFSVLGFLGEMLVINGQHLIHSFGYYQNNIDYILIQLNDLLGVDIAKEFSEKVKEFDISTFLSPILNSLTGFMGNMFMVLFYVLFLFIEESNFKNKLHLIFTSPERFEDIRNLLVNIEHSITQYVGLKTMISLFSATICFFVMLGFGIESPLLWAFIIFILNYLPVIGAFLVPILPTFFSLIQFNEIQLPLILFFILGGIQMLISNIVEPKVMGNSLNISPLIALLALAFWGAIWGIPGMIVSVPITVILIIFLAHFKRTKPIAILLSQNGNI